MGIFDFFKKKNTASFLADFNEKNGDWESAFYFRNKGTIDLYDQQLTDCLVRANNDHDDQSALQSLYAARQVAESFRAWCSSKSSGDKYFAAHSETQMKRIESKIQTLEYKRAVMQTIMERASSLNGVMQSEIVNAFKIDANEVRAIISKLEQSGSIRKEKSGRSYVIRANL